METFFVGKDVASALGYKNPSNALQAHVDSEDKTSYLIQVSGSNYKTNTLFINESGLYSLVLSSKLPQATDDMIWEVCHLCEQEGWNELPLPSLYPRKHRELLRAIVAVRTGISFWKINLKVLDAAYSEAFPHSTPLNVNKKRKVN
ncbi:Bro-N domain-containing protein [Prevotella sp. RM4]|uniref:BRO-N domain-containing protein n=1 Tax=Prevotella sp. RM4 TaxID=1200547 RepID=UPI000A021946|nr:Bro-N domain-containing protein [Prevotella sp. RM4]